MRSSEASLAIITRTTFDGETEYLTQWNEKWDAYSLVGGHREDGESFRDCCIREIEEELSLKSEVDFRVDLLPIAPSLEYSAFSKSAGVETHYRFELFVTELMTDEARKKVTTNPDNRWVGVYELRGGIASNLRPIAVQVKNVVNQLEFKG
jgi:8-oxo-dGTP pyrophosphatase MutT (NUDIX family)